MQFAFHRIRRAETLRTLHLVHGDSQSAPVHFHRPVVCDRLSELSAATPSARRRLGLERNSRQAGEDS
jgi:hypothetical protein